MGKYNFNGFQIGQSGVQGFGEKMSNPFFQNVGAVRSSDYTRIANAFGDIVQNPRIPDSVKDANPYVSGSTTKRVKNDEATVMLLGSRVTKQADIPKADVSSTYAAKNPSADGSVQRNFPAEGYKPFGGRVAGPFEYRVAK